MEPPDVLGGFSLEPDIYLALLSHSGSRGIGEGVAKHFSSLAMSLRLNLSENLAAVLNLPVCPQDLTVIDPHSRSCKRDDKISVLDVKMRSSCTSAPLFRENRRVKLRSVVS